MSYESRLALALNFIKEHNSSLPDSKNFVIEEDFGKVLKYMGSITEPDLAELTWEQILECLYNSINDHAPVKPIKLAQKIASVFRDQTKIQETITKNPKKIKAMTVHQLIENYDVNENNLIWDRLKTLSQDQPFIVFDNNVVDVVSSHKLLEELRSGFPPRQFYELNGEPHKIYKVGEIEKPPVDENPIYIGRALRPDGTCDQLNRSWSNIPLEIRQFVRVGIEIQEIVIQIIEDAHNILDKILMNTSTALEYFKKRYPKTCIEFNKRKNDNTLPRLKMTLQENTNNIPPARKVQW